MSSSSTSVINVNINTFQQYYNALDLGPIPAGTTIDGAVKGLQAGLMTMMQTEWASRYPTVPINSNQQNQGIMQPYNQDISGTAPQCAIDWITTSLNGWQMPFSPQVPTMMASEIANNVSSNAGIKGVFCGQTNLNANETIYWAVGYIVATVIDPNTLGIIFTYTATLSD